MQKKHAMDNCHTAPETTKNTDRYFVSGAMSIACELPWRGITTIRQKKKIRRRGNAKKETARDEHKHFHLCRVLSDILSPPCEALVGSTTEMVVIYEHNPHCLTATQLAPITNTDRCFVSAGAMSIACGHRRGTPP